MRDEEEEEKGDLTRHVLLDEVGDGVGVGVAGGADDVEVVAGAEGALEEEGGAAALEAAARHDRDAVAQHLKKKGVREEWRGGILTSASSMKWVVSRMVRFAFSSSSRS